MATGVGTAAMWICVSQVSAQKAMFQSSVDGRDCDTTGIKPGFFNKPARTKRSDGKPSLLSFLGSSGITVKDYSPQRHSPCGIAARYSTGQEFTEFGVFFNQKLFSPRPQRLCGAISESLH